jgi:hypothetical protein
MSAAAAAPTPTRPAKTERRTALIVYRDDGPLAEALGATLGRALPLPALVLVAAAIVPLLAAIVIGGEDTSDGVAAAVTAWLVLVGGASSGRPHTERLRWMVPPVLRFAEYASLLWFGALAGASDEGAAFALIAAIAFRHYDLVYRLRHRAETPPEWLNRLAAGWDGRLVVACVLLVAGALPTGFYVLAILLGALFVGESVWSWAQFSRAQRPAITYEDEEDEGQ